MWKQLHAQCDDIIWLLLYEITNYDINKIYMIILTLEKHNCFRPSTGALPLTATVVLQICQTTTEIKCNIVRQQLCSGDYGSWHRDQLSQQTVVRVVCRPRERVDD